MIPANPATIVLDADALTSFAGDAMRLAEERNQGFGQSPSCSRRTMANSRNCSRRKKANCAIIRRWNCCASPSKLDRTRAGAALMGAILLLKGADTVVAEPGGPRLDQSRRAEAVARDGGLRRCAVRHHRGSFGRRGCPRSRRRVQASWLHAAAAGEFGPGLIAEDIPEYLPPVLRRLLENDL